MGRTIAVAAVALAVGAAVMQLVSNYKLRLEPADGRTVEPTRLPEALIQRPTQLGPSDSGIVPAGYVTPAPLALPAVFSQTTPPPPTQISQVTVEAQLDGRTLTWDVSTDRAVRLHTDSGRVVLSLADPPKKVNKHKLIVTVNDRPFDLSVDAQLKLLTDAGIAVTTPDEPSTITVTLSPNAFLGDKLRIGVVARPETQNDGALPVNTVTLVRPFKPQPGASAPLTLTDAFTSPFSSAADTASSLTVLNGYLRLKGQVFANRPDVKFFLVAAGQPISAIAPTKLTYGATVNEWLAELNLGSQPAGTQGAILVRVDTDAGTYYLDKLKAVVWQPKSVPAQPRFDATTPIAPRATNQTDKVASTADTPAYRSNATTFMVNVARPADAQMLLLSVGDKRAAAVAVPSQTDPVPFTNVVVPGDGDHLISVVAANGDQVSPVAKMLIRVRSAGPRVASVLAPAFGTGSGRETISVQFAGEELDEAAAVNPANYVLEHNEGDKTGNNNVKRVAAGGVEYNAAARITRLTYEGIVPGTYKFTVKSGASGTTPPGVKDLFDNFLVGSSGTRPADFVTTLSAVVGDAALASRTVGVTLQTGPNVEFPEYTRFRRVPDGFNPSDRVETRVVRLYYNRDAHRVAQIVNRDVKSYNAATVDVRRRAADRARDDADKATDERRRLEREAVRLSNEARQAEKDLQAAANRADESRSRAQQAAIQVGQRQDDLTIAQRDLQRALALAGPQNQLDESLLPQRAKVAQLTQQLAVEREQLKVVNDAAKVDEEAAQKRVADDRKARAEAEVAVADAKKRYEALTPPPEPKETETFKKYLEAQRLLGLAESDLADQNRRLTQLQQNTVVARTNLDLLEQRLAVEAEKLKRDEAAGRALNQPDLLAEQQRQQLLELQRQIAGLRQVAAAGESNRPQLESAVSAAQQRVTAARQEEARATEAWQAKEADELRRREDQFRREVAAAREDPDTYAPGLPNSDDPVRQCSISVVGEGLIQIRGPIKGLNIIRTMVNQLDTPVGQVRIGVHTVQVNGERGDRMERVVGNIQRYIDHARFLTAQSAQMLRKSVTLVASRKAEEAAAQLAPGCSQADRDRKYLYAFYGKDFIDELTDLDSEFLRTGNKLLSLHSMDSTSLSAALFQLALAKNSVRMEILQEFNAQTAQCLPAAEQQYYLAGLSGKKCEACLDKHQYQLAYNAKFQSLAGFFNGEVQGDDTLNPIQREFVRLAQIFKGRLVTELQLKQRVMERALLEERLGNYLEELRKSREADEQARDELTRFQGALRDANAQAQSSVIELLRVLDDVEGSLSTVIRVLPKIGELKYQAARAKVGQQQAAEDKYTTVNGLRYMKPVLWGEKADEQYVDFRNAPEVRAALANMSSFFAQFYYEGQGNYTLFRTIQGLVTKAVSDKQRLSVDDYQTLDRLLGVLLGVIKQEVVGVRSALQNVSTLLAQEPPEAAKAAAAYRTLREDVFDNKLRQGERLTARVRAIFDRTDPAFDALTRSAIAVDAARRKALLSRRPLDEKKLLDMLVDETEDKFIEQLEGTRAHTANIDNYIKSLSTALEDDFNTQFYLPSFRRVREASRYWDVTLGQIETTTVLTNNRAFAKVDPAATFEFDLPKRNIAIAEGFQAAKALVDEYGALLQDPTFIAASKLYGGNPVSGQFGTGGGLSAVRNVLPGLSSSPDELLMAQAGPGNKQVGSALEALIPDPSIYKFETGTGYEIRPVLSPDGQAVVFNFNYMYSTNVREPVRAGEKHLGRVKRHFVHTDVQLSNFELREVSKYQVALKVSRTGRGVQLLQDIPAVGVLFRPPPSAESSLQQNLIYSQATIFPTLFDLMGLRYAPAVVDLDPLADRNDEWVVRSRRRDLEQRVYDVGASRVDDALRIPYGERRPDLYRPQVTIPAVHPNGYSGSGLRLRDGHLQEGAAVPYSPEQAFPPTRYAPPNSYSVPRPPVDPLFGPPPGGVSPPPNLPYPQLPFSSPAYPPPAAVYPVPPVGFQRSPLPPTVTDSPQPMPTPLGTPRPFPDGPPPPVGQTSIRPIGPSGIPATSPLASRPTRLQPPQPNVPPPNSVGR